MDINKCTEVEEKIYCDKVNEDFAYFIQAIPFIEISEDTEGMKTRRLETVIDDRPFYLSNVFFELQWMLYRFKEDNPDLIVDKMLVSKLIIIPLEISQALRTRRGFIIRVKYKTRPGFVAYPVNTLN